MTSLIVPGFAKNILSVKRLLGMGYGVEAKGSAMLIKNQHGKTHFACKQAGDGMFYLSGRRLRTAGIFNIEEAKWKDPAPETVDADGITKGTTEKRIVPKKKEINRAHYDWGHMAG